MTEEKEGFTFKQKLFGIFCVVFIVIIPHLLFDKVAFGETLREPPTIEHAKAQHVVSEGETLWLIAGWYKVSLKSLELANPQIDNPELIYPHERINIPNNLDSWSVNDNSGYESNY